VADRVTIAALGWRDGDRLTVTFGVHHSGPVPALTALQLCGHGRRDRRGQVHLIRRRSGATRRGRSRDLVAIPRARRGSALPTLRVSER